MIRSIRALATCGLFAWPLLTLGALPSLLVTAEAWAQARSSGGYSRPSGGFGRTPSTAGPRIAPRTPSAGGGYTRPTDRRPSTAFPRGYGGSAGDRSYSREGSAGALGRYRQQLDAARARPSPPPGLPPTGSDAGVPGGGWGLPTPARRGPARDPGYGGGYQPDWYRDRGWSPGGLAGGILGGRRGFGVWDGLFLWFLLDNLSRPGSTDFFRNHRDDPGVREFRAEADRLARDNADLRGKLEQLDRAAAAQPNAPRDPNYLPPDVTPEIATAPRGDARTPTTGKPTTGTPGAAEEAGSGWLVFVLLGGGAVLLFVLWRRRQAGSAGMTGKTQSGLDTASAMLRHKLGGETYTPALFRVGMTLTVDPTPFILAADSTKVPMPAPESGGGGLRVSIPEIGRVEGGAADLVRLYLPDGRSLFQLHLDAQGQPDECRFFGLIDEITPADDAEWAAWLDPAEGMIGWPQFQTRDGRVYERVWAPGASRVPPRNLVETIEGASGSRSVRSGAMLYAAPTGLAEPAPQTEYILVAAVEAAGQAWVEVRAGIDVNPAALLSPAAAEAA